MSKMVKNSDRKKSMTRGEGARSARKESIKPERKTSIKSERKLSADPERKQTVMYSERKLSITSENGRKSSTDAGTQRKASTFAERRSSAVGDRRSSIVEPMIGRSALITTSAQGQRPVNVKYENTFRTEPQVSFRNTDVKNCIKEVFEQELPGKTYNQDECCILSKRLAEIIKQKVKQLVKRYKIITVVALGQRQDYSPSVAFTSRCVWNAKFDTFSEYTYKSSSLYAVGLVYVLYAE